MRLGVNGWRLQAEATGVKRYLLQILEAWAAGGATPFERIRVYTSRPVAEIPAPLEAAVLGPDLRLLVWENLRLGPSVRDEVLFCPSHTRPLWTRSRTVVALHDSTPYRHPELFPGSGIHNRLHLWGARRARRVIVATRAAADDLAGSFGVPAGRLRVVPMAAARVFRPLEPAETAALCRPWTEAAEPYFLFVGRLSGRRSLPLLLGAFAHFAARTPHPHRLLLAGLNVHRQPIEAMARELGIERRVRFLGHVEDERLNALYNGARGFISPTVYETVSLPVMEAQAAGCPVVSLDTPGLRETTGGAALLVARPDAADYGAALIRLTDSTELGPELAERGREFAATRSWERTAAETMAVLEEATRDP